jgi:hypothetical protein
MDMNTRSARYTPWRPGISCLEIMELERGQRAYTKAGHIFKDGHGGYVIAAKTICYEEPCGHIVDMFVARDFFGKLVFCQTSATQSLLGAETQSLGGIFIRILDVLEK